MWPLTWHSLPPILLYPGEWHWDGHRHLHKHLRPLTRRPPLVILLCRLLEHVQVIVSYIVSDHIRRFFLRCSTERLHVCNGLPVFLITRLAYMDGNLGLNKRIPFDKFENSCVAPIITGLNRHMLLLEIFRAVFHPVRKFPTFPQGYLSSYLLHLRGRFHVDVPCIMIEISFTASRQDLCKAVHPVDNDWIDISVQLKHCSDIYLYLFFWLFLFIRYYLCSSRCLFFFYFCCWFSMFLYLFSFPFSLPPSGLSILSDLSQVDPSFHSSPILSPVQLVYVLYLMKCLIICLTTDMKSAMENCVPPYQTFHHFSLKVSIKLSSTFIIVH
jgi:hypothetical protein